MAVSPKLMARTTLTASSATLYTVPASTTAVVTSILLCNTTAAAVTATVNLDGVPVVSALSIPANTTTSIDTKQVLATTKTITGLAGSATAITIHVSGTEVA